MLIARNSINRNQRFLGYVGHAAQGADYYGLGKLFTPTHQSLNTSGVGYSDLAPNSIVMSYRSIRSNDAELNAQLSFTANVIFNLRIRHYWARVRHDEFFQIDETNPLPQDFATEAFDILRQLHEFASGPSGPFDGKPTGAQIAFLSARLQDLDASITEVLNAQGANGRAYQEAERAEETQTARRDLLLAAAGEIADVDLAEAAVRLTLAQNQFQASAQAFTAVRGLSLLEFLR